MKVRQVPTRKGDQMRPETSEEYWKRMEEHEREHPEDVPPKPAGWQSPSVVSRPRNEDTMEKCLKARKKRGKHSVPLYLEEQAMLAGYPTPRTLTGGAESSRRKQELGRTESGGGDLQAEAEGFRLPDMTGWKLNPRFSLWLMMGQMAMAWYEAGIRAMENLKPTRSSSRSRRGKSTARKSSAGPATRSSSKRRRTSSKQLRKQSKT